MRSRIKSRATQKNHGKEASMKAHRARQKLAGAENHEIETPFTTVKQMSRKELLRNRR